MIREHRGRSRKGRSWRLVGGEMELGGNQTEMAEGLGGAVEDPRQVGGCHPNGEGGSIEGEKCT